MQPISEYERARAWAEGLLDGDQRVAFEAEMHADEELQSFARSYRAVFQATRGLESLEGVSGLQFEDLEARMDESDRGPWSSLRRVAAVAALVLTVATLSWWGMRGEASRAEVELSSIPLELEVAPRKAPTLPEGIADYVPVRDGEIQWIFSLEEGVELSRLSGAPLVVWGIHPTCPYCKRMRESTLLDPRVLAAFESWVPVQLDVMQTNYFDDLDIMQTGFPVFELRDVAFEELAVFYGYVEPQKFAKLLEGNRPPNTLAVAETRSQLQLLDQALGAERDGQPGTAAALFAELAADAGSEGLHEEALAGVERVAQLAARELTQALAAESPTEALGKALIRFEGSEYATDFARVLEALGEHGHEPVLRR